MVEAGDCAYLGRAARVGRYLELGIVRKQQLRIDSQSNREVPGDRLELKAYSQLYCVKG